MPLPVGHRKTLQPLVDVDLGVHILDAVALELRPVRRVVLREVPRAVSVGFCGLAGHREQLDQPLALLVLLLCCPQHLAHVLQCQRQSQRPGHDHRAEPIVRRKECTWVKILTGEMTLQID